MLTSSCCLDRQQLIHYLNGWLSETEQRQWDQHLAECQNCGRLLDQLEAELTEEDLLRNRLRNLDRDGAPETSNEELPSRLLANLQAISPEPTDVLLDDDARSIDSIDQYDVRQCIGQGGMARVYLAEHRKLKRRVALKVLHVPPVHLAESLKRLEREIQVVGQLHHASIVAAIDAGEFNGCPYLVTEYIDGLDLNRLARRFENACEPLSASDACELVRQACLGMGYAHSQGVIHRDLKPSNLMLDQHGNVKILDFGLGQRIGDHDLSLELTSVGQLLGTLDYMAPEQADQPNHAGAPADLYALGATLYRLLTGRAPYASTRSQSALEKLRLLATTEPPSMATLRPDLPAALCQLVNRCLNRDPAKRPASAAHLAETLQPFCAEADMIALVQTAETLADPVGSSPALWSSAPHATPVTLSKVRVGRNRIFGSGILTWLFGFAFFVICSILVLESRKGQIVIRSEAGRVKVQLLKDGQHYDELELKVGPNVVRLYAGQYEIQVEGQPDQFQVAGGKVELKRGETVIATIEEVAGQETRLDQQEANLRELTANDTQPDRTVVHYKVSFDSKLSSGVLTYALPGVKVAAESEGLVVLGTAADHQSIEEILSFLKRGETGSTLRVSNGTFLLLPATETSSQRIQLLMEASGYMKSQFRLSRLEDQWLIAGPSAGVEYLHRNVVEEKLVGRTSEGDSTDSPQVYDGHPFEYWLSQFKNDLSRSARQNALKAMQKFPRETYRQQTKDAYIDSLLSKGMTRDTSSLGYRLLENEDYEEIASRMTQLDPTTAMEVLAYLHEKLPRERLPEICLAILQQENSRLSEADALKLLYCIYELGGVEFSPDERVTQQVLESKLIDDDFWLQNFALLGGPLSDYATAQVLRMLEGPVDGRLDLTSSFLTKIRTGLESGFKFQSDNVHAKQVSLRLQELFLQSLESGQCWEELSDFELKDYEPHQLSLGLFGNVGSSRDWSPFKQTSYVGGGTYNRTWNIDFRSSQRNRFALCFYLKSNDAVHSVELSNADARLPLGVVLLNVLCLDVEFCKSGVAAERVQELTQEEAEETLQRMATVMGVESLGIEHKVQLRESDTLLSIDGEQLLLRSSAGKTLQEPMAISENPWALVLHLLAERLNQIYRD